MSKNKKEKRKKIHDDSEALAEYMANNMLFPDIWTYRLGHAQGHAQAREEAEDEMYGQLNNLVAEMRHHTDEEVARTRRAWGQNVENIIRHSLETLSYNEHQNAPDTGVRGVLGVSPDTGLPAVIFPTYAELMNPRGYLFPPEVDKPAPLSLALRHGHSQGEDASIEGLSNVFHENNMSRNWATRFVKHPETQALMTQGNPDSTIRALCQPLMLYPMQGLPVEKIMGYRNQRLAARQRAHVTEGSPLRLQNTARARERALQSPLLIEFSNDEIAHLFPDDATGLGRAMVPQIDVSRQIDDNLHQAQELLRAQQVALEQFGTPDFDRFLLSGAGRPNLLTAVPQDDEEREIQEIMTREGVTHEEAYNILRNNITTNDLYTQRALRQRIATGAPLPDEEEEIDPNDPGKERVH